MTCKTTQKQHTVFNSQEDLFLYLATELERYSKQATEQHISLSGGSTPKGLFSFICSTHFKKEISWSNLHFWWGDERCVKFNDSESNYGEAKRLLFDHIDIPKNNIHYIPLDLTNSIEDYQLAAETYASDMKQNIPLHKNFPVYDWILLGVGEDGHTASLFPNEADLASHQITLCVKKPTTGEFRVSISANTIRSAKRVSYLVTGMSKAQVIAEILNEVGRYNDYPAYLIKSDQGNTEYLLDSEASHLLSSSKEGRRQ